MTNPDTTPACGILYVDDEEKALKYFKRAFFPKFEVFTAASGPEALEVLRRESGKIGIVLSDQRMPDMLGAEFLGLARQEFPQIVRILTTAYSDLKSAIQAVNTGYIYQYVVKPWEIRELGMVLQRAADYYQVLTERNELLALKMTTLQRVVCSDRVKWLLLSSHGLDSAAQSAFRGAVAALVKALPEDLRPAVAGPGAFSKQQFEITALIRDEYQNAARCLDSMDRLRAAAGGSLAKSLEAFRAALVEACGFDAQDVVLETGEPANAQLRLPAGAGGILTGALFGLLIERETPDVSVRFFEVLVALASVAGTLTIQANGSGSLVFSPKAEPDASQVIGELYEKFSASDISRL